jgi:hypothetical protein
MPVTKKRKQTEFDDNIKVLSETNLKKPVVEEDADEQDNSEIDDAEKSDLTAESHHHQQQSPKEAEIKKSFEDLGLSKWLIETLHSLSITQPTEIQSACIPSILRGKDFQPMHSSTPP